MKFYRSKAAAWIGAFLSAALSFGASPPLRAQSAPAPGQADAAGRSAPFAFRAQLEGQETSDLHRVQVPLSVYDTARDPQLHDLRVFDAAGQPLPFAWVDRSAALTDLAVQAPVPLFPIGGRTALAPGERMVLPVERGADGSLAPTADRGEKDGRIVVGALFDLTRVSGDLQALVFADYRSDTPFHSFSLEASDDLKKWTLLRQEAQIVRLKQDDRVLQQNLVELGNIPVDSARYLRLLWRDPKTAPQLVRMDVRASAGGQRPRAILWTEPQSPVSAQQGSYEYSMPPALPIDRLRINLSRSNMMAPVQVDQYVQGAAPGGPGTAVAAPASGWREVARSVAYRLESGVTEIVAPDIALDGKHLDRMRVSIDTRGGRGDAPPPTVQVGFHPDTLVFRASGPAPYTLAWGMDAAQDTSLPPERLVAGYSGMDALPASVTAMHAMQRLPAQDFKVSLPTPGSAPLAASHASPPAASATAHGWSPVWGHLFTLLLVLIDIALALLALRAFRAFRRAGRANRVSGS
jgi:hypothetical protein